MSVYLHFFIECPSDGSGSRQLRRSTSASGRRGFDSKLKNPFASLLPRPPPQLGDLFKRPTGPNGQPLPNTNWKPDNLILMVRPPASLHLLWKAGDWPSPPRFMLTGGLGTFS